MKLKITYILLGLFFILFQLYKIIKNTFYLGIDSKNMGKVEYVIYYIASLIGYNIFALVGLLIIIIGFKKNTINLYLKMIKYHIVLIKNPLTFFSIHLLSTIIFYHYTIISIGIILIERMETIFNYISTKYFFNYNFLKIEI